MNIVLDTHIVVHAAAGAISSQRKELLEDSSSRLFISAVTLWEITKLVEFGQISLPDGFDRFMRDLCAHPRYAIAQYDAPLMIELLAVAKRMHKDPADQIIVATALRLGAALMTDDVRIRRSEIVKVV
ncbi:MAG TPA: type II toxin-antitoxin system VapC family toxin [Polyangia bacterium]|nr:type II toxin-antitoxin system VapC family toxin [Polyangia bacterium]